jgi:hypothetical protein
MGFPRPGRWLEQYEGDHEVSYLWILAVRD